MLTFGLLTGLVLLILPGQPASAPDSPAGGETALTTAEAPVRLMLDLPPLANLSAALYQNGIPRTRELHTKLPDRPRFSITKYTVVAGDTIWSIGEKFHLDPSSVLWGNLEILGDNPHNLRIGMELNILPEDGVYHLWREGEGLNKVSEYYGVKPEDIIDWPGNNLSRDTIGDYANPNIKPGTYLFIPGGKREFISWTSLVIRRENPGVAKLVGPGACGTIAYGAVGTGTFVNPTTETWLSGYDYSPGGNHWGVDFAGKLGNPVVAADAGVVVYSGWNNFGYGNVVVIDHGNGWQTLYAHLNSISVVCGQSVAQGSYLGELGSTGRSSGPHLHFEMMYNGARVNPHEYLNIGASIYTGPYPGN